MKELNNKDKEIEDIKSSLTNTEVELMHHLFELNESNKKRDILQEDLEEIIEKNNNLDTSNEELKKGKAELDREIIEIKNELKEISEEYENVMNSTLNLIEENKNQDGKINNLEEQLEIEKKNTETLVNKRDELNNKLRSLRKLYSDIVQQFEEKEKKSLEKVRSDGDLVEMHASPSNEDKKFELSESPTVVVPASPTNEDKLREGLKEVSKELKEAEKASSGWGLGLGEQLLKRDKKPIKQAWMSEEAKEAEKKLIKEILNKENKKEKEDDLDEFFKDKFNYGPEFLKQLSLNDKIEKLKEYKTENYPENDEDNKQPEMSDDDEMKRIQSILKSKNEERVNTYLKNNLKHNDESLQGLSPDDKLKILKDYLDANFSDKLNFWRNMENKQEQDIIKQGEDAAKFEGMGGGGKLVDSGLSKLLKVLMNKIIKNNTLNLTDYNKKLIKKINKNLNNKPLSLTYINKMKVLTSKIYKIIKNNNMTDPDKNSKIRKYLTNGYIETVN